MTSIHDSGGQASSSRLIGAVRIDSPAALRDSLFLAVAVILSCLPYIGGLGLYSDDWTFLSAMHRSDGTFLGALAAVMPIELATRPVQGVVLAGLYRLFGVEPLGYHVFNCLALTAAVLLFYHSLRALGLDRIVAVVVPLLFGLLPHYSTDRFWIAVFQANTAILLYFVSLFADVRFVQRGSSAGWLWKLLGSIALASSVLAYEVTAALFVVNVGVLLYAAGLRRNRVWTRPSWTTALAVVSNLVVLGLTILYKMTTTVRAEVMGGLRFRVLRILTEAAPVHFGEYGIAMPLRVVQALHSYAETIGTITSVIVGLVVAVYLFRVVRPNAGTDRAVRWPVIILIGGALFGAGYGVSLMTWEIGFHTTGANNRTAIGAAIGVAWVFAGAIGWFSSVLPDDRSRRVAFAGLIALLAASCTLLTNTVASFWVDASRRQHALIANIQQQFPQLPGGSTLLLDGICPFHGPAPVFATGWDTTGMLQLTYNDGSLRGDVIKPNTELTPDGVRTLLFDDVINVYPYGEDLIAFHAGIGEAFRLTSIEAARVYLTNVSMPARPACPPYTDGDGVPLY